MSLPIHPTPKYPRLGLLLPILTLMAALLLPASVGAEEVPQFSPDSLAFTIQPGDSLTLYTTLTTPTGMTNLGIENNGLVNDEKTANIPPDKVLISPASGDIPAGPQRFAVTIQQPEKPGHYTGELFLRYSITDTVQTLPLALDVNVVPKPDVSATTESSNQVLSLRWRPVIQWLANKWFGITPGSRIIVTMVQAGSGEAVLNGVKIDSLRGNKPLESSALVVSPAISATVPLTTTAGTADLTVGATSINIPPGEYKSNLRVSVAGQADAVVVPFTVKSKAGVVWPVLITLLGFLLGWWSIRYNKNVHPLTKLLEKVAEIEKIKTEPQALQIEDVEVFGGELKKIQRRMMAGEEAETLETALDALIAQIKTKREENRQLIQPDGELGKAIQEMQALEIGVKVRDAIVKALKSIRDRVEEGSYPRLAEAQLEFKRTEPQRTELVNIVTEFNQVVQESGGTIDIPQLIQKLNAAEDPSTLKRLLDEARAQYKPRTELDEALSYTLPGEAVQMNDIQDIITGSKVAPASWEAFTTSLKAQRRLAVGLTAGFALVGGLIALYAPNATWGASITDYVTLAVWALGVNLVGGQAVDFKASLQPPAQA